MSLEDLVGFQQAENNPVLLPRNDLDIERGPVTYQFCSKMKECGHLCKGVKREIECLPCLAETCVNSDQEESMVEPQDMIGP